MALRALRSAGNRPYLGIALGILAVSTASIFTRYAQQAGVPSLVIAAYRVSLASLVRFRVGLVGWGDIVGITAQPGQRAMLALEHQHGRAFRH